MFDDQFHISELIAARLQERISPEQEEILTAWLNSSECNRNLFEEFYKEEQFQADFKKYQSVDSAAIWNKTINKINAVKPERLKIRKIRLWPRVAAVASLLLIAGVGFYFYKAEQHLGGYLAKHDIPAGKNKATLTLANGRKIILSDAMDGELAAEAGVSIYKTADGQLVYKMNTDGSAKNAAKLSQYNTVSTAHGEQYQVILPDLTKVWLNAASSIKFPSTFNGLDKRRIELSGEAYFEVTKDKAHPFIVKTAKQEVQVLGTHFNVNSYPDESATITTLLEGSVRVNKAVDANKTPAFVILKPNQQSNITSNRLTVQEVDAENVLAWKNGLFMFNYESLDQVMRKISRWYDVEVVFDDPSLAQLSAYGSISKYNTLSKVLLMMEKTGDMHFKVEGRRVTVVR